MRMAIWFCNLLILIDIFTESVHSNVCPLLVCIVLVRYSGFFLNFQENAFFWCMITFLQNMEKNAHKNAGGIRFQRKMVILVINVNAKCAQSVSHALL